MFIESRDNPDDSKLTFRIMSSSIGRMILEKEFIDEGVTTSDFFLIHDAVIGPSIESDLGVLQLEVITLKLRQYQPPARCVEMTLEDDRCIMVVADERPITGLLNLIVTKRTAYLTAMMHDPRFAPERKLYN